MKYILGRWAVRTKGGKWRAGNTTRSRLDWWLTWRVMEDAQAMTREETDRVVRVTVTYEVKP